MADLDETMKADVYDFLECLRDSGITNMFGARPYLIEEFDFEDKEAADWLASWMRSFGK